ncbi:MAG: SCO family protein [Deltaproteobacteria bacterium]|nr:SCO family protein [Deltaproteobacteria bacterium]
MKKARIFFLAAIFSIALAASPGAAISSDDLKGAAASANMAVGNRIGDYTLTDQDGKKFKLRELLDRPLVVSFVYTKCVHTCDTITARLAEVFKGQGLLGKKYRAVTIGFDTDNDTPEAMRAFAGRFTKDFKSWSFASADRKTVEGLTRDTGFYFKKTGSGFEHLNMVSIVGADGAVYAQVYGLDFKPDELLSAIDKKQAMNGPGALRTGILDRIKLLCYTYDESTGTYRPDYTFLMSLVLGAFLQVFILFLALYLYRGSKKKSLKPIKAAHDPHPR